MNTATQPRRVSREVRSLLTLALPIMIGRLATTATGFVDTVMAQPGRLDPLGTGLLEQRIIQAFRLAATSSGQERVEHQPA